MLKVADTQAVKRLVMFATALSMCTCGIFPDGLHDNFQLTNCLRLRGIFMVLVYNIP